MIERFKNEKIAIIVNTQQEYNNLMKLLEKHNLKWSTGDKATKLNYWGKYKKQTCICYDLENFSNGISYCRAEFFKNEGYKIINYNNFIKGVKMKKEFTKKDLKDGDIVTYKIGWKRTVKGKELLDERGRHGLDLCQFKNDLTYDSDHDFDIVKVERKTKTEVVYERKKEILDEAEKRYLRDVIRPFRNKVVYIQKVNFYDEEEYIYIDIEKDDISMPVFKKDTMYKGMELNKKYLLEELGL